ncbi:MAG TPA: TRAP transporter small permease [Burkholderiales bacterium]|nr:TRAP transporter small permease [Burkholderiales bacterium]
MQEQAPSAEAAADAPLLSAFDRRLAAVETSFNLISSFAIFALMLLGVWQVLGRTLFNTPVRGYIDFVELSMATFAFLGIAYCQRLGGHVRMEMVLKAMRGRLLWGSEVLGTVVALAVIAVLIWYGWGHFLRAYQLGDSTIDAELPVWPSKLAVPVAFALLWLRLWVQFAGYLRLALDPQRRAVAVASVLSVEEQAAHEIDESLGATERGKRR